MLSTVSDKLRPGKRCGTPLPRGVEPGKRRFALVDCDNFYVSCERVFDPSLVGRPVVVLSNNDGCIISRSAEAKGLGIKMGAPLHHVTEIIRAGKVAVRSSNYALYGDMSRRVIETLCHFTPEIEVYSIDEAFLGLDGFASSANGRAASADLTGYAEKIRRMVLRWTGLPVSIGIGQTKTLAKVAAEIAKRRPERVCDLSAAPDPDALLGSVPVRNVWGVGSRHGAWLIERGITSAAGLRDIPDELIQKRAGIVGLRTVWELRGRHCLKLELVVPPRKGVTCSRSFGRRIRNLGQLQEAVATYASRTAEKLRRDNSVAGLLTVFLMTNSFGDGPSYSKSATLSLTPASDNAPDLIRAALRGLDKIYRSGFDFHKAGVTLTNLTPAAEVQTDIFAPRDFRRSGALNRAVDRINRRLGAGSLRYATLGIHRRWRMRQNFRSPAYTTRWSDIPRVNAGQ